MSRPTSFITILCILFSLLAPRTAAAVLDRTALMATASLLNLALLSFISFEASQKELGRSAPGRPLIPNYNFSPDDPEYILLEKLSDRYTQLPYLRDIKVLPRAYFEYYLDEVECAEQCETIAAPNHSIAADILRYLRAREQFTASRAGWPYIELAGQAAHSYTNSPNRAVPKVTGSINPIIDMKEGAFNESGHNVWLGPRIRGALTKWLSYEVTPRLLLSSNNAGTQQHVDYRIHRAYLKFNANNLAIELGKDTVQWGFGREGTMKEVGLLITHRA